jgi:hypothetical protein
VVKVKRFSPVAVFIERHSPEPLLNKVTDVDVKNYSRMVFVMVAGWREMRLADDIFAA